MSLNSSQLFNDPRLGQARELVLQALAEHQKKIVGIRPPNPEWVADVAAQIAQFAQDRGGPLYYPYISSGMGNGALIELTDGSIKYDFINGIGAHFGHSLPGIVSATFDALLADTVMQGNLQQSSSTADLIHLLTTVSGLDHCFLTTSGAMAAENALKMVFQAKMPRRRLLAFEGCFMGRTIALASVTDKAAYREGLPIAIDVDYVPFFSDNDPDGSTLRAVATLKSHLKRYPGDHAGMAFELVQGEGGYYTAPRSFFVALMDVLRAHEVAIIVDEIQTFGRLSRLFAFQHFELDDYVDVVTVGKITQVCATLFRAQFKPRPGLISQTFTGASTAIAAGIYIINQLVGGGYFGPNGINMTLGTYFSDRLAEFSLRMPSVVSGPFGMGMMVAFTPFGGDEAKVKRFSLDLYEAGVIGFTAGSSPMRMRFLPPLGAVSQSDIDAVMACIGSVISKGGIGNVT